MGTENMPDQSQALLALQQHAQQQAAGGKGGMGVLGMFHDINITSLSPKGVGFGEKMIPGLNTLSKSSGKPGLIQKIFESVREDFKKSGEGAKIIYDGAITNGAPPISGLDGGASFASMVGSRGGGTEIG